VFSGNVHMSSIQSLVSVATEESIVVIEDLVGEK
jgi:hypothetical protein